MKKSNMTKMVALLLVLTLLASLLFSLTAQAFAAGEEDTIHIRTAQDLTDLAEKCTLDTWSQGKTVILEADISLADVKFSSIPTFGGTFDGGGHTISGLNLTRSMTPAGLFGVVQEDGVIRNLNVSGSVELSGSSDHVGGIAGENYGFLVNCSFTGNVAGENSVGGVAGINALSGRILNCSASGSVVGDKMTGGIAGCNLGVIEGGKNSAYVNTVSVDPSLSPEEIRFDFSLDLSSLSTVDTNMAASDTGGIAGYSSGVLLNCTNSAPVGYPHIGYNVGGVAGRSCGYLQGCMNTANVFGRKDVGGIAGQMEPYIARNITESTLTKLENQLNELDTLLDTAISDADAGVGTVTSRLNRIADYMNSAAGAAKSIRTTGSVTTTVTGSGQAEGGGSVTVTPPQAEAAGSGEVSGGAAGVTTPVGGAVEGEVSGGGAGVATPIGGAAGGEISGEVAGGTTPAAGAVVGGASAEGEVQAGLTEGSVEGETSSSASGNVNASTQVTMTTNLSGLSAALSGMSGQMKLLNGEISGTSGTLSQDVKAIQAQISAISDTALELFRGEDDEDVLVDSSEVDIDLVTLGKASDCVNRGSVSGDINVGGITGAMAMEYELDPEDDITSNLDGTQRRKLEVKAIIHSCENRGEVTAKRSYAGGICGRMDLGLIARAESYGNVTSEGGDYVGGIAGLTSSTIRHCFVKCTLSGQRNIGGVVGSGVSEDLTGGASTVAGCYSMVSIEEYQEFAGAVSGVNAGDFVENYFVSDTLAGINGRSYAGKAEPMDYARLLELAGASEEAQPAGTEESPAENTPPQTEEAGESDASGETGETEGSGEVGEQQETISIPEEFLQLSLTFVAEDQVIQTVPFSYGNSFDETVFPEIPRKEGYYANWNKTAAELENLHFDTVVTAEYTPYVSALSDGETRSDGRPIFFIEGQFDDGAEATVTSMPNTPGDFDNLAEDWKDFLLKSFSSPKVCREIVEQWKISIPNDGQTRHTVRYLPPDGKQDNLEIYVKGDSAWKKAETQVVGSYLTFTVEGNETEAAAISTVSAWWIWLIAGGLVLILLLVIIRLIRRAARRRKGKNIPLTEELEEAGSADNPQNNVDLPYLAPKKKRRWLTPLLVVLALLAGVGGTAAFFLVPDLLEGLQAYELLKDYAQREELTMSLSVDGELDGMEMDFTAQVDRTTVEGQRVTTITQEGRTLYYSEGVIFLENGDAYLLSEDFPDYSQLLEQAISLYQHVEIEEEDEVYTITAEGEDAKAILELLLPSAAGLLSDADTMTVELMTEDGEASQLQFTGSGTLADSAQTPFRISAVLDLWPAGQTPAAIPEAVKTALLSGDYEAGESLTGDLIRLARAWQTLNSTNPLGAEMELRADCGPVTLNDSLDFYRWNEEGVLISSIQKNGYQLYFTENTVCNQEGTVMAAGNTSSVEAAKLLDIAHEACMNARLSCTEANEIYTYTLSLDKDGMKAVAYAIAPATEGMDVLFDSGSIQVVLEGETLRSLEIRCGGTVQVVLTSAEVSFEARMAFAEGPVEAVVPEAVRKTLKK